MRIPSNVRRIGTARKLLVVLAAGIPSLAVAAPHSSYAAPRTERAPYAGYVNHAHTAPAFHWGWFGAERYAPHPRWHRDYNGDLMRWNAQRRY